MKIRELLSHLWWQGVAAIVGVFALIAAIMALLPDDPPPAPPPSVEVRNNSITGDNNQCNAQGEDIRLSCVLPAAPIRFGDVSIAWPYSSYYVFAGNATALPTPPPYGKEDRANHCDKWADWLASTPGMYAIGPGVEVGMTSSETEVVAITRIEPKVFERKPLPADHTVIRCQFGSGGDAGFIASVDTRRLSTKVEDYSTGKQFSIPPGSLYLSGQESASGQIKFRSEPRFLYEGALEITAKINGVEKKITLGEPDRPLRWITDEEETAPWRPEDEHGWDMNTRAWKRGHQVFQG
ncbi:hypothetical protein AB0F88_15460 [Streptosporangium sp. NPDC023963]|uniref:hypothetical protein n=1 Tax=Streptosporangium sp. NPDC023963 TaxID=3155608 RepID=UPI003425745E